MPTRNGTEGVFIASCPWSPTMAAYFLWGTCCIVALFSATPNVHIRRGSASRFSLLFCPPWFYYCTKRFLPCERRTEIVTALTEREASVLCNIRGDCAKVDDKNSTDSLEQRCTEVVDVLFKRGIVGPTITWTEASVWSPRDSKLRNFPTRV